MNNIFFDRNGLVAIPAPLIQRYEILQDKEGRGYVVLAFYSQAYEDAMSSMVVFHGEDVESCKSWLFRMTL